MFLTKKVWSVLTLVLALGLVAGCDNIGEQTPKSVTEEVIVFSYNVDELAAGLFGNLSPTMTMNEYCLEVTWPPRTYDELLQEGFVLFKDEDLEASFAGSDIVDENTVVYSDFPLNDQGEKTGEVTGTITLTNVPHPDTTKVYIHGYYYEGWPDNWLEVFRKIDMSSVTGTSATLNWSLPVYESFKPPSQATFELIVLPGDSLNAYTVTVPARKAIGDANGNIGSLGTVSIRGVTLSGTINVTHNGAPVPYVEIFAIYEVQGTLNITCLSSPGPDAPWSVTFGVDNNMSKEMKFQVFGYSEKNGTMLFDKFAVLTSPVRVFSNQDVSGIVLDMGDIND